MAARVIASRMTSIYANRLVGRGASNSFAAVPAAYHRHRHGVPQQHSVPSRRCFSTSPNNTTSVTDLLRQCAEEQRGFESILPLKSLMFSLRSQNALTWSPSDLVNLTVGLCYTSSSYDRTAVWQALAPLMTAVTEKLTTDELSNLLWSLQCLPKDLADQKAINSLLDSINNAMRNTATDDWREEQLARAAYCVPVLDRKSPGVKVLLRTLKARLRDAKPGDGVDAAFVAMHLQQSMDVAGREVVDLYAALLERCTTIRGTSPHRVPRDLLRNSSSLPTSKSEVRRQWDQLNPVDAGASILALYGSQHVDVLRGSNNELCYVLYEALGWERSRSVLPLPMEPTLTGDSKDVHTVLRRLYENIGQQDTAPSAARALGTSLYGLQQLSGDVKHVRQLLSVSAQQLTDSTTDLYVQEMQRTLHQPPSPNDVANASSSSSSSTTTTNNNNNTVPATPTKLSRKSAATSRKPSNT